MRGPIHIVATFADACGGSEGRAVHLYELLREHAEVRLWTEQTPDPVLARQWPIERIVLSRWHFPHRGDVIFVGAPRFGTWVHLAHLGRVTVIYNSDRPDRLERRLRGLARARAEELRVVFASERIAASVPHEGTVQLSPIDLERFAPAPDASRAQLRRTGATLPFRIGRHSRDERYKHGESDPALYRRLADAGCEVQVRGGTCLEGEINGTVGVRLEAVSPREPERFLQGLDAFIYRTRTDWFEASARVVVEALACGLPVVADRRGGYVEYIEDGVNGFLFESDDEAYEQLLTLARDPELHERMGSAARASAEELYAPRALQKIVDFYVD
ncbi:MAG: glycosyltransferase family 4 protein [bacterium]|nr:glycosyltransferase family 4 protein [bacterium]